MKKVIASLAVILCMACEEGKNSLLVDLAVPDIAPDAGWFDLWDVKATLQQTTCVDEDGAAVDVSKVGVLEGTYNVVSTDSGCTLEEAGGTVSMTGVSGTGGTMTTGLTKIAVGGTSTTSTEEASVPGAIAPSGGTSTEEAPVIAPGTAEDAGNSSSSDELFDVEYSTCKVGGTILTVEMAPPTETVVEGCTVDSYTTARLELSGGEATGTLGATVTFTGGCPPPLKNCQMSAVLAATRVESTAETAPMGGTNADPEENPPTPEKVNSAPTLTAVNFSPSTMIPMLINTQQKLFAMALQPSGELPKISVTDPDNDTVTILIQCLPTVGSGSTKATWSKIAGWTVAPAPTAMQEMLIVYKYSNNPPNIGTIVECTVSAMDSQGAPSTTTLTLRGEVGKVL
ncbi:MAG: hypothetical protein HYV02_00845 [Deltaproteobacteria bacterium]|nr:hypothetical protein [Deltaproteobacteria bacterium]